ncbi:HlyD family efflux transporter periplasmic adaptor subunit [Klebsiella pneumoniae]|nr:HlyD family efflux transporter periplasmic adaptor subunit [Klebsiella pneumoniae]TWY78316.1 HlyD family efflux transporter periplasmic adaptor subunit [Klebsiella pneumoniae]
MDKIKKRWAGYFVGLLVVLAAAAWWLLRPPGLPAGFASSNGRIEATEVDIASKIAGRIDTILVKEGQFVHQGEVLARMDTRVLNEQRLEAAAQIKEAESAVLAARALLDQRQSEMCASEAVVKQRQAELDSTAKRHVRSNTLSQRGAVSAQQLDDDRAAAESARAAAESARAALESAKAQVSAARAAIEAARTSIIQAQTRVEAAQATERRILADIDDSELKAPRDGRIQYRVAEPGEVLAAGGRVLNMVDLADVYMTFFLPTEQAGLLALGSEARLVLDAAPDLVIPANISFVASVAQFTPKTVETSDERLKLMFRVKARIPPELLAQHLEYVKTGLPGMAYVRLDKQQPWPEALAVRLPQ